MESSYQVLVVGAGLAGLQTAWILARQGCSVLLVDAKERLDRSIHTTGIFVRRSLEDFPTSLPEDCLGPPIRHVRLFSPSRRRLDLESPHVEFRVGQMGKLYRRRLEAARQAGVEFLAGVRFVSSRAEGERGSQVLLERGGERWEVNVGSLVGCDGARSRVARDLGLSRNRRFLVGWEEVYRGVSLEGPPRLECFVDPRLAPGYIAWWVHDGEESHLGVAGRMQRGFVPRSALDEFRDQVRDRLGLEQGELVEQRGGPIPVGGVLPKISAPRGLLVGDASGAVSPLTAGGLDPCLRQAELAASVAKAMVSQPGCAAWQAYCGRRFRRRFTIRCWLRHGMSLIQSHLLLEAPFLLPDWLLRPAAASVFFGRGSFPDTHQAHRRIIELESKVGWPSESSVSARS